MNSIVESRKTECRYITDDPKRMLGKWIVRRVFKTWVEECQDKDSGEIVEIERNEVLLEKGTYIDEKQLASIEFFMQSGDIKEIEVSNQNRQGILEVNTSLYPYKAAAKINGKRSTFLLYATSVANALVILIDWIELNCKGEFSVTEIKEMDYCIVLTDRLKSAKARRYELDMAYLKGEIPIDTFVEATCDNIANGNPDADSAEDDSEKPLKQNFYQIGAHVVLHDDKEGDQEEDHTFIVQTVSAVRANMLIEQYLRDKQEERYVESLSHPERTFVKYEIHSFIEEAKIIPIGYFIPESFSLVYHGADGD